MKSLVESLLAKSMSESDFWKAIDAINKQLKGPVENWIKVGSDAAYKAILKCVPRRKREAFANMFFDLAGELCDRYVFKDVGDDGNEYCSWGAVASGKDFYDKCMQAEEESVDSEGMDAESYGGAVASLINDEDDWD